jgi:hypothetical protein
VYEVAYARHINSVLHSKSNHQQRPCVRPNVLQSLSAQQVRHLIPSFLPLKLLADVTKEFVQTLRNKHRMNVIVYWDGDKRYTFKQATDGKRQCRLEQEWADYHQYCENGRMTGVKRLCQWASSLPKHRLFSSQVLHALLVARVDMVFCEEEADRVLAKATTNNPAAYIVGSDSDFCFFPNVNYIPLPTLDASRNDVVTACVIRRDTLTESLRLPDENAMIELAILLGNDYVDPSTAELDCPPVEFRDRTDQIVLFLRDQGAGYRVTSKSDETQDALRFVRMLYSLGDLTEFDCLDKSRTESEHVSSEHVADEDSVTFTRPHIADEELNGCLRMVQPDIDKTVKGSVLRCLRAYVDRANRLGGSQETLHVSEEHLTVLEQMSINERQTYKDMDKEIPDKMWRPKWDDVLVVYLIEKIVNRYVWDFRDSPLTRINPPYSVFDPYVYHALLRKARDAATSDSVPNDVAPTRALAMNVVEPEVVERPSLPIDEFETDILASVRKHRVTVIQGDTGCGKSSRIPIMLLRAPCPDSSQGPSKLFISQPRRIAAKALVERLRQVEPDLRDQIALRMGHGVRGTCASLCFAE